MILCLALNKMIAINLNAQNENNPTVGPLFSKPNLDTNGNEEEPKAVEAGTSGQMSGVDNREQEESREVLLNNDFLLKPAASPEAALMPKIENNDYATYLRKLRDQGRLLRSDGEQQPKFSEKPDWLDMSKILNAKRLYQEHFMAINYAHLTGLLLLVRVDSIHRTLKATGKSDSVAKLFKRYYSTMLHVRKWYEGDLLSPDDPAQQSLKMVRGMHNKVSSKFNDRNSTVNHDKTGCPMSAKIQDNDNNNINDSNTDGEEQVDFKHISQYDIMITQFAFVGFMVTFPTKVGLLDNFTRQDLESLLHFWRLIGHYLGALGPYNLCSYEVQDVIGLCKALNEIEYLNAIVERHVSSEHGLMSLNIARSVKFIPMMTFYALMKRAYEMLKRDTTELEHFGTCYSKLSYYIIDLVMCRFLAYKPLRAFNNGLIRFSIYLVGRYESWFCNHLELSHGPGLRM